MMRIHTHFLPLALLAGIAGCHPSADHPLLRLEARGFRFTPPAVVSAGPTYIRLVNLDPVWHEASLIRFTDSSATLARYIEVARGGEEYPPFAEDLGGVSLLAPGDSAVVLLLLPAGRYAIICWHQDHILSGMGATFEVRGDPRPLTPPKAAIEFPLRDFAIPPLTPHPGSEWLHVTNAGPSEHEVAILRLEAGRSLADYLAWRAAGEIGPPPARTIAGSAALRVGADLWLKVPWTSGRYAVLCLLEDPNKRYHNELGMQAEFTIP